MILQALRQYYRRCDDLARPGWIHKEVDFAVVLKPEGEVVQVADLREQRDRKLEGRIHSLPNIGKQALKHTNSLRESLKTPIIFKFFRRKRILLKQ